MRDASRTSAFAHLSPGRGQRSPLSQAETAAAAVDASGVFETCRVRRGKVVRLEEHLRRLRASAKTVGLPSWDERTARRELEQAAEGLPEGYVRISVRRGGEPRVLLHRRAGLPYSKRQVKEGVSLRTVPTRWPTGESAWAQAKLSERLSGVLARAEAPGAPEALRLNAAGYLTEGTVSNLFFVRGGCLATAPSWLGALEGVTRARVIGAAKRLKVPVREIPFTRHDLFNAEEAFLTNVLMEILPVREVDGRRIGGKVPGPVTRRLAAAFRRTGGDGQ